MTQFSINIFPSYNVEWLILIKYVVLPPPLSTFINGINPFVHYLYDKWTPLSKCFDLKELRRFTERRKRDIEREIAILNAPFSLSEWFPVLKEGKIWFMTAGMVRRAWKRVIFHFSFIIILAFEKCQLQKRKTKKLNNLQVC